MFAVWLCGRFGTLASKIAESAVWRKLDSLSYPIYLVHYMFMKEPFDLEKYLPEGGLQVLAALVLTLVSALILQYLEKAVNRLTAKVK